MLGGPEHAKISISGFNIRMNRKHQDVTRMRVLTMRAALCHFFQTGFLTVAMTMMDIYPNEERYTPPLKPPNPRVQLSIRLQLWHWRVHSRF